MIDATLGHMRRFIPASIFATLAPLYHRTLALIAAVVYRFPSRKLIVVGVTGTKGKSSTVEILNAILEEAGYRTALTNTIRFKVGEVSSENLYKMSMPGRFFMQRFLRTAVKNDCTHAVIEMTSQGSITYRHRHIDLDAFVFTNLSPEHIEAHGSYESYRESKLELARSLGRSRKKDRALIVNGDDSESHLFLECPADRRLTYSLADAQPYAIHKEGLQFTWGNKSVGSRLSGAFNLYNILAAATAARALGVDDATIIRAIERFDGIPGRVQKIEAGQDFSIVVDYAHTPDSLEKLYQVFQSSRSICVLGGTGGGRDTWKRKKMGSIADQYCDEILLTDEDPYDEDPRKIIDDVARGISSSVPTILMDRRAAIHEALRRAKTGDAVLITGKGTDPYIMGPKGSKTPWSDAKVAAEEMRKLLDASPK